MNKYYIIFFKKSNKGQMQLRGETIEPFSWKKKNKLDGNIVNVKKIQKFSITKLN